MSCSKFFSVDNGEKPYAVVRGGSSHGTIVYLNSINENSGDAEGETNEIDIDDGKMELLPSKTGRDCIVVAGKSGSGKSYWSRMFIKNYMKMFPKREVMLFSPVEEDKAFDDLDINKIILDEDLLDNPIDLNELENSLVVFDDTDSVIDPKLKKMIIDLQDRILEIGRHKNISSIITIHKICDYKRTRTLLNEAHYCVLFLRGNRSHMTKYYLKNHQDISRKGMKKLYALPSRWICFCNTFP
ncbi:hypothetical protein EBU94_05865, partial [bacterium]|nr:hypothetical protein [bacterium]